jgi:ParB family chromosome partitioning protein
MEENEQSLMIDSIVGQKLSVRDVEQMAKNMKLPNQAPRNTSNKTNELNFDTLQSYFSDLGIKTSKKGSKLTLEFDNNGQIDSFLATLSS